MLLHLGMHGCPLETHPYYTLVQDGSKKSAGRRLRWAGVGRGRKPGRGSTTWKTPTSNSFKNLPKGKEEPPNSAADRTDMRL